MTEDLYTLGPALLGPLSKRPSPSQEVRLFVDKDTGISYVSNGTTWVQTGSSLSGVTNDGANGIVVAGALNNPALRASANTLRAPEIEADAVLTAGRVQASDFISIAFEHDGHVGDNDNLTPVATLDGGGYASGCILQRVPAGHTMTDLSVISLNATLDPSVSARDALESVFLYFVPDNGSGAPDFTAPQINASPIASGVLRTGNKRTLYFHVAPNETIDHSYWLMVNANSPSPYASFLSLDSALNTSDWPLSQTYTDRDGDGSNIVDVGLQHQLYWAFSSDHGFSWTLEDGTVAGALSKAGLALAHMLGENGKTPPASPVAITGTLTSATLPQLTSIVSQLLVALDAKGAITKSTT